MIRTALVGFAAFAISFSSSPILAGGDVEAGKKKAEEVCAACHGADGNSADPQYPKLAGQYESYLLQALQDYKSGERKNAIMAGFTAGLDKQDMRNLAAYFASLEGDLRVVELP